MEVMYKIVGGCPSAYLLCLSCKPCLPACPRVLDHSTKFLCCELPCFPQKGQCLMLKHGSHVRVPVASPVGLQASCLIFELQNSILSPHTVAVLSMFCLKWPGGPGLTFDLFSFTFNIQLSAVYRGGSIVVEPLQQPY